MAHWTEKTGSQAAVLYCQQEIKDYSGFFTVNHRRWRFWQVVAIVFGVIGTVLAAIDLPDLQWFHFVRPLPVAMASIATGLLGSFSYQADAVRQGATADSLQGELARFLSKAAPYNEAEEANISAFMNAIRMIISAEQSSWQSQTNHHDPNGHGGGPNKPGVGGAHSPPPPPSPSPPLPSRPSPP